jgi:hypothetical protein
MRAEIPKDAMQPQILPLNAGQAGHKTPTCPQDEKK